MPEPEYVKVYCSKCGEQAMPITEAYLEHGLCLKCFYEQEEKKKEA